MAEKTHEILILEIGHSSLNRIERFEVWGPLNKRVFLEKIPGVTSVLTSNVHPGGCMYLVYFDPRYDTQQLNYEIVASMRERE